MQPILSPAAFSMSVFQNDITDYQLINELGDVQA